MLASPKADSARLDGWSASHICHPVKPEWREPNNKCRHGSLPSNFLTSACRLDKHENHEEGGFRESWLLPYPGASAGITNPVYSPRSPEFPGATAACAAFGSRDRSP